MVFFSFGLTSLCMTDSRSIHVSIMCVTDHVSVSCFSRVRLFVTLWTAAYQVPLSIGFSRQQYWSGLPCPPPGDLPHPGMEPASPALQADSLPTEPQVAPVSTI